MSNHRFIIFCVTAIAVVILSCGGRGDRRNDIILATTTSFQDTGLLDALVPMFENKSGYRVKAIAVGSGQALFIGKRGEADILLVHSPEAEEQFMKQGYGLERRPLMQSDFVIIGPHEDSARIRGLKSAPAAFRAIARAKSLFISRGDKSGTHMKEKRIWQEANIDPEHERWYQQTGMGMGQTIAIADEKRGYTLADRGTYLTLKKQIGLVILIEGCRELNNPYHVILVHPKTLPLINAEGARAFADFLGSPAAQHIIRTYGVEQFGQPLFHPMR